MDIDATVRMEDPPKKRLNYDPTINLGHILTFIGFMASGFVAYNNLDKRLSIQEQMTVQVAAQRAEKDQVMKETLKEMQGDVKELSRSVNELGRLLSQQKK